MEENVPLYRKMYEDILTLIRDNAEEYRNNSHLPSERELSERYHMSRTTVRAALKKLAEDGYIYTVRGSASFVCQKVFEQSLNQFYSFTDGLKNDNIVIDNTLIDYREIRLDETLAEKLHYPVGTEFHKLIRLRSAQDYPLMIETTYLPKQRFIRIDIDLIRGKHSLYKYLTQKYDFRVDSAYETFRPVTADQYEKKLLKLPSGVSCLLLERYISEAGDLTEYTRSIIRGDKYQFSIKLK